MDEKMAEFFVEYQELTTKINAMRIDPEVQNWAKDIAKVSEWGMKIWSSGQSGYNAYQTIKAVKFASQLALFIEADLAAMQGIAVGMSAPGVTIGGRVLITAGGTAARVIGGSLGALNIGIGIYDIVNGVKDI